MEDIKMEKKNWRKIFGKLMEKKITSKVEQFQYY